MPAPRGETKSNVPVDYGTMSESIVECGSNTGIDGGWGPAAVGFFDTRSNKRDRFDPDLTIRRSCDDLSACQAYVTPDAEASGRNRLMSQARSFSLTTRAAPSSSNHSTMR